MRAATSEPTRGATALLVLFCIAMAAATHVGRSLTFRDETRVAGIAREMALEEQWATPRLNGSLFLEYPPAGYWPLAGLLRAGLPATDLVAQLPVALAVLGILFLTFRMARRIAGAEAAWLAVVVLQCTIGFNSLGRRVLVDPLLCFWITLALHGALFALAESDRRGRHLSVFYLGLAGGFLSKGLIGIVLPAAAAVVFLALTRQLALLPRIVLHPALLAFVLPIGSWLWALASVEGTTALAEVWQQSVFRALSSRADHARPLWFYFGRIPYLALPALVLVPFIARDALGPRQRRQARSTGPFDLFGSVWFLTMFSLLCVASAKRNVYLGPIYPGLALAAAGWWARAREQTPDGAPQRWLTQAVRARPVAQGAGLGVIVALALGIDLARELPLDSDDSPRQLFEEVVALQSQQPGAPVVLVRPRESLSGAAVYYLGETVQTVYEPDQLEASVSTDGALLVGKTIDLAPLLAALPKSRRGSVHTRTVGRDAYQIAALRPIRVRATTPH